MVSKRPRSAMRSTLPRRGRPAWSSAAPKLKPSRSMERSLAPSGAAGEGRLATHQAQHAWQAGVTLRRGRTPFERVTPSTTMARRG